MTLNIVRANPDGFVGLRVGVELKNYQENLKRVLERNMIEPDKNFILTPISSPRMLYYGSIHNDDQMHLLPDLVLPSDSWWAHVAISIQPLNLALFEDIFKHGLYLPTPVIVIDCPETQDEQKAMATIINRNLSENQSRKYILFRNTLGGRCRQKSGPRVHEVLSKTSECKSKELSIEVDGMFKPPNYSVRNTRNEIGESRQDDWRTWNNFRSLLLPDDRIGLCLDINNQIDTDTEGIRRWNGEPVRLVVLHVDAFSSNERFDPATRLVGRVREFVRTLALANSLKIGLVVKAKNGLDMRNHLQCLSLFCDMLKKDHEDPYRAYDDTFSDPLQPLSKSLDSSTYQIFEYDKAKYTHYQEAMYRALVTMIRRHTGCGRNEFVAMVLGAGRGPLVDAMIKAINGLRLLGNVHFKIYAIDKNPSSVRSLLYKRTHFWGRHKTKIEIKVAKADMRVWQCEDKADIIVSELLGSLSDNELSPECIDGCWRFSTPQTICIPQSYSSFIGPILSYRIEQQVHRHARLYNLSADIRDSLQVVRLTNYYLIDNLQELFTFKHHDVSKKPIEGANRREKTLKFTSKVDTVCHGFVGYLLAELFEKVSITTIPDCKTPQMESWFPAFIPIDKPIELAANASIEVTFWRKDCPDKVWYEWQILKPIKSRIHSLNGHKTAMFKQT